MPRLSYREAVNQAMPAARSAASHKSQDMVHATA
jgi:hypothetical protein